MTTARRRAALVVFCAIIGICATAAAGGLLPNPILRGSINLRPYGCIAPHNLAYWKGHVYVSGAADSGEGPTVWDVGVTNPAAPTFVQGVGSGYKAYGTKIVQDKLYVANWYTLLRIHNIYNGALTQIGEYFMPGRYGWSVDVTPYGRAYVGQGVETYSSIESFDVTNPSTPRYITGQPSILSGGGFQVRGSYIYSGDNHYSQTIPLYLFVIRNISDETNPYVLTQIERPFPVSEVHLRGDYAYLMMSVYGGGGLEIWDISDPVSPTLVGSYYSDVGGSSGCLYGNYAFYATSGNGVIAVDISNPANPRIAAQPNLAGYELCVKAAGRYLYMGNLAGDYQGTLNIMEFFDSDPDDAGPGNWSGFSLKEASWDTQYEADAMPRSSSAAWRLFEGTESIASVSGGVLHINDNQTTAKVKWTRNWDATNTFGGTVLCRARCASYEIGSGSIDTLNNIFIEDGKYQEAFAILSDRLRANWANIEVPIDGTQWHTYRITTKGSGFQVYVDEAATPIMTGTFAATTSRARVMFGSGSTLCKQDIYIDYVYCYSGGVNGPAARTNDTTPDISVSVADTAGKGSLSGIDPATAQVYWSTDGGVTWTSGGCPVTCTPVGGLQPPDRATITAQGVPFNQYSETLNKVRFSLRDRNGNIGFSPVYNVRIDPNAGPRVVNVTSPNATGTYKQGAALTIQVVFDRNITLLGGPPRLKLAVTPGGRLLNCTGVVNGNTLVFPYTVQLNDSSDCLDYTDADALILNGAIIKDDVGAEADVRLPPPGGPGSLCANKSIKVDAVRPVVTSVTSDLPDGTYGIGQAVDLILAFSEPVVVSGTPQLELETGIVDRKADYVSGSGSAALSFRYTVQRCDASADLDYKAVSSLSGGTIKDVAGNFYAYPNTLPTPGSPGSLSYNKNIAIDTSGSIAACKLLEDGAPVEIGNKVLYLKQGSVGYIEEPNRSAAVRIEGTITSAQGDLVCLAGTMRTTTGGERYVLISDITTIGTGSVAPLGVTNRALGARLTDGLYVRAWGVVTSVSRTEHYYTISDGSDSTGIKVVTADEPTVSLGDYVCPAGAAGWDSGRVIYAK